MPIVKVLGAKGDVLHDCIAAGCTVSWDGYRLVDGEDGPAGEQVAGAEPLGERWHLLDDGATVQATHAPAG